MAEILDTSKYDNVVVIDTQVVLEARPLEQLPWSELFTGSVLLLVVRQVQSEIDAKKNDGRLGRRARSFNKLLESFIETRLPANVKVTPRVDITLVSSSRIDWELLDDLDRGDGDDKIVAQALNAAVDDRSRLEILSHDMRPRDAAITHGLKARKLPETWLLEPQPSPDERKIIDLENKLRVLSADQPQIAVSIKAVSPEPWRFRQVTKPSADEIETIKSGLYAAAPRAAVRDQYAIIEPFYDSSHAMRLDRWRQQLANEDLPGIDQGLTRLFAQHRLAVTIENVGQIHADGLSLEIRSGNAVIHSVRYWILVDGEPAPQTRYFPDFMPNLIRSNFNPPAREPFHFYWDVTGPGDYVSLSCTSFRQGKTYEIEASVELTAMSVPKVQLVAVVTASNMKGDVRIQHIVEVEQIETAFADVYDPKTRNLVIDPPVDLPHGIEGNDIAWLRNDGSEASKD